MSSNKSVEEHEKVEEEARETDEDEKKSLKSTLSELQLNLIESQKYERELRIALAAQIQRTNELQEELKKERNRTEKLYDVIKDLSFDDDENDDCLTNSTPPSAFNDLKSSFETVSPMLMQYKYDELKLQYQRCMKIITRKDKILKKTLQENDQLQIEFNSLKNIYKTIQQRTEVICCKYLKLKIKKEEEVCIFTKII